MVRQVSLVPKKKKPKMSKTLRLNVSIERDGDWCDEQDFFFLIEW